MTDTAAEGTTVTETPTNAPTDPTATPAQPTPPAPAAVPTARFALPAGVVPPITLRNELVKQGLAPATLKPQQMYAWVKAPGKDAATAFPVKWYDVAGNVYDKQPAGADAPLTRPGLTSLEAGIEWYKRRATAPATPPATTDGTAHAAPVATTNAAEDETDETHGDEPIEGAE
jgi:hypothetical protein